MSDSLSIKQQFHKLLKDIEHEGVVLSQYSLEPAIANTVPPHEELPFGFLSEINKDLHGVLANLELANSRYEKIVKAYKSPLYHYRFATYFAGAPDGFLTYTNTKDFGKAELDAIVKEANETKEFEATLQKYGFRPITWHND